ncbi:RHS repeat-associated core domain-containing protein [Pseudomonas sp. SLFW]|uniref:RHS repeat-associated core domain-containing protein n=1 Tax=Pseudomonas sp. SLFW TaxID=2683259 RepID=UPI0014121742|nr:RHS repeat-associated core domain-containing protein [Pseudomonas sp. SLFW]NBB10727.1 glycohydrolase toxin TNT-related protein [Pseudomonas sp. SLFW]
MSDPLYAARLGDALSHTSMMADILGGVLEVAANVAITALATAAVVAATGITVATGGLGACVLGVVVGVVVGVAMSKTGADKGLSELCEDIGNGLFPPTVQANILTGSTDTFINGIPAARAAGAVPPDLEASGTPETAEPAAEPTYLDMAKGFFAQMWRPTVAVPAPGVVPKPLDLVLCTRHPPMPPQFLAEGSDKVTINGQPAVRSGDRSTCDATVVSSGLISPNVRIGGGKVVVREIRSGKTPGIGLAIAALMMLKGGKGKFVSNLPCMLLAGATSFVTSMAVSALTRASSGAPNPVHAATGAKVLGGEDELDAVLPALLPIHWQRVYNSRDERIDGLFGMGWNVRFEVSVELEPHPDGGQCLIYTDEQGRLIDMGLIPLGGAVFSAGEGLSVRRHGNGQLLIESEDGLYRLFEPTPSTPARLRLTQLGDRNHNRIYLDYDDAGRLTQLRDTFEQPRLVLGYSATHPRRVARIERVIPHEARELLASYDYDARGQLIEVRNASGIVQRRFAYDEGLRMCEHQLPAGLRCFYQWACVDGEWRVAHHWTDQGDEYRFDYDVAAGVTRITDNLNRVSTRCWNAQHQITEYRDNLGHLWRFEWNDERQLLSATDPQNGRWEYGYDEAGNLCSTLDPLGRRESTVWLEHWALPLAETDSAGSTWRYRYDQRGNRTEEVDPSGHATRYRHDALGRVVEIIDASGRSKTLRWNDFGQLLELIDCSGYPTRYQYDARGQLISITDALGERTQLTYDAQGHLNHCTLADGRTQQYQRSASGQLIGYLDPAGHLSQYHYDRRGTIRQRVDAQGRRLDFEHDAFGRLNVLTNENGEHYRFTWDANDRLTEQLDLDGSARRYRYDALGNVTQVAYWPAPFGEGLAAVPDTPPAPIVHELERDSVGRLIAKVTDDGRTEYQYNARDQMCSASFTDTDGVRQSLNFAYNASGQLLQEQNDAGSLTHVYDELGNLAQTQLPDGRWLNRLHYGSGHLHQINLDGVVISDFERDRLHREVLRTQGQSTMYQRYDRTGRLHTRLRRRSDQPAQLPAPDQQHFEYDPGNNLVGETERQAGQDHRQLLHYDATGRILASQGAVQGQHEIFAYDPAANLLDATQSGSRHVLHNKLLTYQDKRYRYDAFGRMVEKRSGSARVQRFSYDAEHRLTEVRTRDGVRETIVHMQYDPLGRRIAKVERNAQGTLLGETRFVWDGLRLLQEHKHGLSSLYVYADNGQEPLARVDGTGAPQRIRYYQNDLNGSPQQLLEPDGTTLWRARYRTWGNTVEEVREAHFLEEQNLRFQGQYLDRETGLHYNTFRFYDPDIGRFTTKDPIGLQGGFNLYAYAPNPITYIDPLGLSTALVPYWPPNRGALGPIDNITLQPGTIIDRYGYPGGTFTSPVGIPYTMRALPPGTNLKPYTVYEVMKPIPNVSSSKIAPWFGELGYGQQFELEKSVQSYLDSGHLREVKKGGKCGSP